MTGGSAGGHLAALTALSQNDPALPARLRAAPTRSVAAAVPFYGVYDFLDRADIRGRSRWCRSSRKQVFKCTPEENRELWEAACPITRVSAEAPPFLVVHGTHDTLVFVEEAREFVRALREKSQRSRSTTSRWRARSTPSTCSTRRARQHAVRAAAAFLEHVHAQHEASRAQKP